MSKQENPKDAIKEKINGVSITDIEIKSIYDRDDADVLDVPFRIRGFTLRWVSSYKTESRKDGLWKPLKKSELPEKVLKLLEESFYALFGDSDVIRNRELVLCYAPKVLTDQIREKRLEKSRQAVARITQGPPQDSGSVLLDRKETSWESGQERFLS